MRFSVAVVVAAVLWLLPQQLGLQGEDVIEDAVDAASLEPVIRYYPGTVEEAPQRDAERAIDPELAANLRLLQELKASVKRYLFCAVLSHLQSVPRTSTRPAAVTRT